ncbi:MAG: ShlB/FhaC/HecB family hemolysin secretion/activation protein [Thermosynechococcaceae cyanobacterium]
MIKSFFLASLISTTICIAEVQAQIPPFRELHPLEIPEPLKPQVSPIIVKPRTQQSSPQDQFPTLQAIQFVFIGNNTIPSNILSKVTLPYLYKKLSFSDLIDIRNSITQFYVDRGYINSGALILSDDNQKLNLNAATLTIRIVEGGIDKITIDGTTRLKSYILKHLDIQRKIFNINKFKESLKLLEDDPLIKKISATLEPGNDINTSNLTINVKPRNPYKIEFFADNYRNSGVGTFERGVDFSALNPLKIGDRIDLTYSNSNGSNALQASYAIPLNRHNTTLKFVYSFGQNTTIQAPFQTLDIQGSSQSYNLELRHPVFRHASEESKSELGITLGIKHQQVQDSILGFPFPISRGANSSGQTRTSILSLQQDWRYQDSIQAANIQSRFNFGIDLGSATDPLFNHGHFFSWQGAAVWSHRLPWNLLMTTKLRLQFSDRPVVASEQFSLGGFGSVVGYSQDAVLGDNGIFGSIEIRIPVYEGKAGTLSLSPIFSAGHAWNNPKIDNTAQSLASVGLGLKYDFSENLSANLSWGFPLIDLAKHNNQSLQDAGILLGLQWRL